MKKLHEIAPKVHDSLMNGGFVERRTRGIHNAVSLDMLLEQNFNADAKEDGGLSVTTINAAARAKWLYTKPITADPNCC